MTNITKLSSIIERLKSVGDQKLRSFLSHLPYSLFVNNGNPFEKLLTLLFGSTISLNQSQFDNCGKHDQMKMTEYFFSCVEIIL